MLELAERITCARPATQMHAGGMYSASASSFWRFSRLGAWVIFRNRRPAVRALVNGQGSLPCVAFLAFLAFLARGCHGPPTSASGCRGDPAFVAVLEQERGGRNSSAQSGTVGTSLPVTAIMAGREVGRALLHLQSSRAAPRPEARVNRGCRGAAAFVASPERARGGHDSSAQSPQGTSTRGGDHGIAESGWARSRPRGASLAFLAHACPGPKPSGSLPPR